MIYQPDYDAQFKPRFESISAYREALTQVRLERNWTYKQIADTLNVSITAIQFWECGRGNPTPEQQKRICRLYGIPLPPEHMDVGKRLTYPQRIPQIFGTDDSRTLAEVAEILETDEHHARYVALKQPMKLGIVTWDKATKTFHLNRSEFYRIHEEYAP